MRTVRSSRADVAVSIVLVLMLGTFTIAQINNADEIANRVRCASNLRQIGQAILLYSNENRGAYPRTTWDVNTAKPTWGTPYEGDAKLGGRAVPLAEDRVPAYWDYVYAETGFRADGPAHIFTIDLVSAAYVVFTGDGRMRRLQWPGRSDWIETRPT